MKNVTNNNPSSQPTSQPPSCMYKEKSGRACVFNPFQFVVCPSVWDFCCTESTFRQKIYYFIMLPWAGEF